MFVFINHNRVAAAAAAADASSVTHSLERCRRRISVGFSVRATSSSSSSSCWLLREKLCERARARHKRSKRYKRAPGLERNYRRCRCRCVSSANNKEYVLFFFFSWLKHTHTRLCATLQFALFNFRPAARARSSACCRATSPRARARSLVEWTPAQLGVQHSKRIIQLLLMLMLLRAAMRHIAFRKHLIALALVTLAADGRALPFYGS